MSEPLSGALNMAMDESILEAVSAGAAPPTLRLYAWSPPCLSLGYAQPFSDVDQERVAQRGWTIVRRPTGGRAILHTDELTYSVIAPIDHPDLAGGVMASYQRLSFGLFQGLKQLGLEVAIAPEAKLSAAERSNPVCFEVPSAYEIEVLSRKLIGSAQVRRVKGVLQHGTLPLTGDIARICDVLDFPDEESRQRAKASVRVRAATVSDLLGQEADWEQAARALIAGFEQALGWDLNRAEISSEEEKTAHVLSDERYSDKEWTERV